MPSIIIPPAEVRQSLFGAGAERLARDTGFRRRWRRLTAPAFARTLWRRAWQGVLPLVRWALRGARSRGAVRQELGAKRDRRERQPKRRKRPGPRQRLFRATRNA